MSRSEQKVVQYLTEAHAHEMGLVRVLQSQIAMTPRGSYRTALENHLGETRDHAERVAARAELSAAAPIRWRRSSIWPRPLSRRRSRWARPRSISCAAPAARRRCSRTPRTPAPPRRSRSRPTPRSSSSPARSATRRRRSWPPRSAPTRRRCSSGSCASCPKLTAAVVGADVKDEPSYDVTKTGAAADGAAQDATAKAKRTTRQARKVPGVAQAEGQVKGAVASESDLRDRRLRQAHRRGDRLEALRALADRPREGRLLRAQAPEPHDGPRAHHARSAATSRGRATTSSPSPSSRPPSARPTTTAIKAVRTYERAHKARAGVLKATERELATA